MEKNPIPKRSEEILNDLPTTNMHPTSRMFLHKYPVD